MLRVIIQLSKSSFDAIFPKSRKANIVYFVIGYILANPKAFLEFIIEILSTRFP